MFYFNCQLIKKMIKVVVIGRPTPSCFYWYTVHTTYRLIVVKFKTNSTHLHLTVNPKKIYLKKKVKNKCLDPCINFYSCFSKLFLQIILKIENKCLTFFSVFSFPHSYCQRFDDSNVLIFS